MDGRKPGALAGSLYTGNYQCCFSPQLDTHKVATTFVRGNGHLKSSGLAHYLKGLVSGMFILPDLPEIFAFTLQQKDTLK